MLDLALSVGPHLMEGFEGVAPEDPGVQVLRTKAEEGHIGGVILFSYNIEGPDQLQTLTRYMASWDVPEENKPLLIAVDQEGGRVQRLAQNKGFRGWPSPADVGASSLTDAQSVFSGLPDELQKYGINVNFAPVVDVAQKPESIIGAYGRSYGGDHDFVAAMAKRAIQEHRQRGIIAAVKHFPGLGACTGDTHEDLIDGTDTWSRDELIPYQTLLGTSGIDAIMSTHMVHRRLKEDGMPLTFSRFVMRDLLRNELGFDGVLFTDDLGMGSIVRHFDVETVVAESLFSGHDMLVFGQNAAASAPGQKAAHQPIENLFERAQHAVDDALASGRLHPSALAASRQRLKDMRKTMVAATFEDR